MRGRAGRVRGRAHAIDANVYHHPLLLVAQDMAVRDKGSDPIDEAHARDCGAACADVNRVRDERDSVGHEGVFALRIEDRDDLEAVDVHVPAVRNGRRVRNAPLLYRAEQHYYVDAHLGERAARSAVDAQIVAEGRQEEGVRRRRPREAGDEERERAPLDHLRVEQRAVASRRARERRRHGRRRAGWGRARDLEEAEAASWVKGLVQRRMADRDGAPLSRHAY
jgi:hypothetical protein